MINPLDPLGICSGKLKAEYSEKLSTSTTRDERESWTRAYLNAILLSYIYWVVLVVFITVVLFNLRVSF